MWLAVRAGLSSLSPCARTHHIHVLLVLWFVPLFIMLYDVIVIACDRLQGPTPCGHPIQVPIRYEPSAGGRASTTRPSSLLWVGEQKRSELPVMCISRAASRALQSRAEDLHWIPTAGTVDNPRAAPRALWASIIDWHYHEANLDHGRPKIPTLGQASSSFSQP